MFFYFFINLLITIDSYILLYYILRRNFYTDYQSITLQKVTLL
nr:MAG TPA: hypothetical protein [Bacteriophage sp.]DAU40832.1 MAG TPA: hypothetical protein [Caudoviricetes sp.]